MQDRIAAPVRYKSACLLLLPIAACKPPPTDEVDARGEIVENVQMASKPITSPDSENAIWGASSLKPDRLIYGNPGEPPMLAIECESENGQQLVRITRYAPADEGAKAMMALIGNGHRSRLKVDATAAGEAFVWEGAFPAGEPQLDALTGRRSVTVTIPGAGMITLNASGRPGELIETCRARGEPAPKGASEEPEEIDLSDEPAE